MPILTIIKGEQAGTTFELANRPLSVGRDPTRDIQLLDQRVSRKQAMIRHDGSGHLIAPLRSTNPILVNGEEIHGDTLLRDGDEIAVGDTALRFTQQVPGEFTNAVHHRKVADRLTRDSNTIM